MRKKRNHSRNDKILQNKKGIKIVASVLILLTFVLTVNGYQMLQKQTEYNKRISSLESQIKDEKSRTEEIAEYKDYTLTREFIEETAKSKLGLVYPNEIIFKNDK